MNQLLISDRLTGIKRKLRPNQLTLYIALEFSKIQSDGIVASVSASGKMTMVRVLQLVQASEIILVISRSTVFDPDAHLQSVFFFWAYLSSWQARAANNAIRDKTSWPKNTQYALYRHTFFQSPFRLNIDIIHVYTFLELQVHPTQYQYSTCTTVLRRDLERVVAAPICSLCILLLILVFCLLSSSRTGNSIQHQRGFNKETFGHCATVQLG